MRVRNRVAPATAVAVAITGCGAAAATAGIRGADAVLGRAIHLTPGIGDVNLEEVTVERVTGSEETYLTAISAP
jgi:hypothetical protein